MRFRTVLLAPAFGLAIGGASAAGLYSLTDLGTLGGDTSFGIEANDSGQVVGYSFVAGNNVDRRAFLYSNGHMTGLGLLNNASGSEALGINNLGQVVGSCTVNDGIGYHATLWSGNAVTDLGTRNGQGTRALHINDSGLMSAVSQGSIGDRALYYDGTYHAIPIARGVANDVNASGQITGIDENTDGSYIYANGVVTQLGHLGTGAAGGTPIDKTSINSQGEVAGSYHTSGGIRAYLYSGGDLHDLGAFHARDLNDSDEIVGAVTGAGADYAVYYSHGILTNLNTVLDASGRGYFLSNAITITNSGYIVGNAITPNGLSHAVLLTPRPVPEPLSLLALGAGALAVLRRRTR